ncbi:LamG-like jellyroll fold domain-containing protein [Sphingobacterium sp. Lzh-3]|uniref:LamG-like jellyroll fold domain-containing protein n=1 Tax=Sphingobacterium sp. Lzh-3 TaxID=3382150 RepID=UPI00398CA843
MAEEEGKAVLWPDGAEKVEDPTTVEFLMCGNKSKPIMKFELDRLNELVEVNGESMPAIQGGATSAAAVALPAGPTGQNRWFDASWGYWKYNNVVLKNPLGTDGIPQGNDGTLYWNGTTETWSISKVQLLPSNPLSNIVNQDTDKATTPKAVFQYSVGKTAVKDVIKLADYLAVIFFNGYYQASGAKVDSASYLSIEMGNVSEGDIYNLSGYMRRDTTGASGIRIQLHTASTKTDIDLKGTDTYRLVVPAGYIKMTVIVAYNYDGNQNVDNYRNTFKIVKGDVLETKLLTPEIDSKIADIEEELPLKISKSDIEDVIVFPDNLVLTLFNGYYNTSGSAVNSLSYLSFQYTNVNSGDVLNLSGYMRRDTSLSSGIKVQLRDSANVIVSDIDLKGTNKYRLVVPNGVAKVNGVIAYNYDGNQNVDNYRNTFKIVKGDVLETEVILPTQNTAAQNYHLYDTNTRKLTRENQQLQSTVKSLRKIKGSTAGELPITIQNRLGIDVNDAVAIVHLHWKAQTAPAKLTNDYFMNQLCQKDFSDIRFIDENGALLDIHKESYGNYEIIADNRIKWQMCASADAIFGSDPTGGLFMSTDNLATWVNISLDGVVSGCNRLGDILYYKNNNVYKRKKSENFAIERLVLQGNEAVEGEKLFNPVTFAMDDLNNLYIAPYQGLWDGRVYKSTDDGETFVTVHQNLKQHCHSLAVDRSVIPNAIYANFDGDAYNHGLPTSAGTFVTYDRGATWNELVFNTFSPDYGVVWSANGKTLGGGESQLKPTPMLFKRENNKITTILDEQSNISGMRELNGNLYLPVLTVDQYKYSKIFRSADKGETWSVVMDTGYRNVDSLAGSWRYGMQTSLTPVGDTKQLMLQYSSSRGANYPAIRIYEGGDHYQAMFYVKIGFLPAAGKTIKVGYGYLAEDVSAEVFTDQKLTSEAYRIYLNELGDYIADSENNTYKLNNSKWDWSKSVVRFGKTYPHKLPMENNGAVILSNPIQLPDLSRIKKTKGFSFSFWVRTTGATGEMAILANDYISFTFSQNARINAKYNNSTVLLNNVIKWHQTQQYAMMVVTISDASTPVMTCYTNTYKTMDRTVELTGYASPSNAGKWILGGSNDFYMSDFRFFDKELTHNEVIQIFEGGRVANF